jgi:hypothetical protein
MSGPAASDLLIHAGSLQSLWMVHRTPTGTRWPTKSGNRQFTAIKMIPPHMAAPGGSSLSYMSFVHGAVLFSCWRLRAGAGLQSLRLVRAQTDYSGMRP